MAITTKPATGPFTRSERILITIPVLIASLLHSVNMSTAYVALPNIQGNLSATPDQVGWIITAFVVASATGTIITGWLSNRLGRRRVFLMSIAGFTITGALCASAAGLEDLVLYRVLQGLVSAPLLPISQAIMLDTYPRHRHGFAMSIWSMGMIMGPVLGPTIGAIMTEIYNWRWVFSVNVPLGIVAFISIYLTLPEADKRRDRLDWIGVASLVVAVSALQLMLDRGQRLDWFESPEIVLEACITVLGFYIFITHCSTARNPYITLSIFRDRNFVVGLALIFVFGLTVFSTMFILPAFLQTVQGYPVITAGWVLSARGLGTALAMLFGGILADRFSSKNLILSGVLCIGVSQWLMTKWTSDVGMEGVIYLTMTSGFGMGLMWVTLTAVTFSTLSPGLRTEGAALFALIRAIGASIGTSVVVAILVRIELRKHINPYRELFLSEDTIVGLDAGSPSGILSFYHLVGEQAQMIGFLNSFYFSAAVVFLAIPLLLFLKTPKRQT
jgi:DHA2 family multidrug resistance protein